MINVGTGERINWQEKEIELEGLRAEDQDQMEEASDQSEGVSSTEPESSPRILVCKPVEMDSSHFLISFTSRAQPLVVQICSFLISFKQDPWL